MSDNTLTFQKGIQITHLVVPGRWPPVSGMFVRGHNVFIRSSSNLKPLVLYDPARHSPMNSSSHTIQIRELNDDALIVKRPIDVELTPDGDMIIATFREAEIVSSGEFAAEAINWLKDTIASSFRLFSAERQALGPLPTRQLKVLEQYIGQKQTRKK